jgi:hypothetical protein
LKRIPRGLWLALLLLALGWYWHASRPLQHAPGVLVAAAPSQRALPADAPPRLRAHGVTFAPLAAFSATARVLARADYHWDALAAFAPIDLALGWGRMSDSAVLRDIDISQSVRFYFWRVRRFPIPEREIIESSANMHLIAADPDVARAIARTRVGDVVDFDGYLVEIDWPDGSKARSSLTRNDSGSGACEIVWVERISIAPR